MKIHIPLKQEKPIDFSALARELGRKGGASKSEKKRLAAQMNGKLGGRPKKALPPSFQKTAQNDL